MKIRYILLNIFIGIVLGGAIFFFGLRDFQMAGYIPTGDINWFKISYILAFLIVALVYTVQQFMLFVKKDIL